MKQKKLTPLIAAMTVAGVANPQGFPDIDFIPRKSKGNQRHRCNDYSPESPEVVEMTKQFNQKKKQESR